MKRTKVHALILYILVAKEEQITTKQIIDMKEQQIKKPMLLQQSSYGTKRKHSKFFCELLSCSMKRAFMVWLLLAGGICAFAESAQITFANHSERSITVKVMKYSGGLYSTVYVGPKSSRTIYIGQQGYYYTKTKAEKTLCETIYSKDDAFFVQNNSQGYSVLEITYWIQESKYPQSSGTRISKSEFDNDNK